MIDEIHISGFKRFTDGRFALRKLTILAGINGSGKSSVLQAILLAREAFIRTEARVELNGPFGVELGSFGDVANHKVSGKFQISFASNNGGEISWIFEGNDEQRFATYTQIDKSTVGIVPSGPRSFQYLSAERLGPRIVQASSALPPEILEVGCQGERTAQVLNALANFVVDERRLFSGSEQNIPLLKPQVELWLSRITQPIQIDIEEFGGVGLFALKFRTSLEWVKPTNMGFGITYVLPIIVAGLIGANNSMLVVENPEAHLHPSGQSQIGVFLASIAAAGVQVILETHSDHVLNGIRRAIGERGIINATDAVVHFFTMDEEVPPSVLSFTESGGIADWPKGFFDQYQIDVSTLTQVRRRR